MGFTKHNLSGSEKLDAQEQRKRIFERDGYKCRICGKSIYIYGTQQLAHRIGQGIQQRKKYGDEIIYHSLNMWSVCSLECNAKADITRKTVEREALIDEIFEAIDKGEQ